MWLGRFAIATVVFTVIGLGIWGLGHMAGCDADRREYLREETVAGQRWLRHPIGFRLRHPGDRFVEDRAAAERFQHTMTTACDAYTSADGMLTVCVFDGLIDSREAFQAEIEGARSGMANAARQIAQRSPGYLFSGLEGLGTVTTLVDDVGWVDGRGTAYLHVIAQGHDVRMKAFTLGKSLVVAFGGGSGLESVIDSLAKI